jgi:hypothetical protein
LSACVQEFPVNIPERFHPLHLKLVPQNLLIYFNFKGLVKFIPKIESSEPTDLVSVE